ncbi:FAD-dependent oxidoreductase [Povalibacter sp.]|uniref:FAD-dependent oxidoreductase n=1 Tax=Povalibacter sp. TaxID=1962978 RepID=UPI002F40445C
MDASISGSAWLDVQLPTFPALSEDLAVDVLIVGGGLTGITTAYLMSLEGIRVALVERDRLACADTARTTAHLTYVTDERLHRLAEKFGTEAAVACWKAGELAIDTIEDICKATGADAQFVRVPGHLHTPVGGDPAKHVKDLQRDAELAAQFGFDVTFMDTLAPMQQPAVRFQRQAKFHPRRYLRALLPIIERHGGRIFEKTAFEGISDDAMTARVNGHSISCRYLVIATHNPLMGKRGVLGATLFQTKLSLYTSYVLGARLPAGTLPEALFWDTQDPYEYLRVEAAPDHQWVIFGGSDVKTGQESDTNDVFLRLQARLQTILPRAVVERRWMGQVVETDDGLPFMGENDDREFIATGFCGNGFTFGTLAAMMARDRFLGRENAWQSLFETSRPPFHGGTWRYLRENADFPYYFIRDRLQRVTEELDDVPKGEGRIVNHAGRKVAAYRDAHGAVTLLSNQCTHLRCLVHWNRADSTWDCPCHGSRFRPTGEVLSGPAESPLEKLDA